MYLHRRLESLWQYRHSFFKSVCNFWCWLEVKLDRSCNKNLIIHVESNQYHYNSIFYVRKIVKICQIIEKRCQKSQHFLYFSLKYVLWKGRNYMEMKGFNLLSSSQGKLYSVAFTIDVILSLSSDGWLDNIYK